jgi:uncharacterized protein
MKVAKLLGVAALAGGLIGLGYGLTAYLTGQGQLSEFDEPRQLDEALKQLSAENPEIGNGEYQVGDQLVANQEETQFDPAYPLVEWDNLMPADWDPMAAFRGLDFSNLQDNDPRAQKALEAMRKAWNEAPVNMAMSGQQVRIPGFALPLEQSEAGVTELLLVPYFGACIHTPPPPANQIIHVKLDAPEPALGAMQPYWIWGQLSATRFSNELGDAAYQIQAKGIQPYDQ